MLIAKTRHILIYRL